MPTQRVFKQIPEDLYEEVTGRLEPELDGDLLARLAAETVTVSEIVRRPRPN